MRRRRSAEPSSCPTCRAELVEAIATNGEDVMVCPVCVELLEVPELEARLVLPHVPGPDDAPPCPRCTKPLGAGFCPSCGWPEARPSSDRLRRIAARARRALARRAAA